MHSSAEKAKDHTVSSAAQSTTATVATTTTAAPGLLGQLLRDHDALAALGERLGQERKKILTNNAELVERMPSLRVRLLAKRKMTEAEYAGMEKELKKLQADCEELVEECTRRLGRGGRS